MHVPAKVQAKVREIWPCVVRTCGADRGLSTATKSCDSWLRSAPLCSTPSALESTCLVLSRPQLLPLAFLLSLAECDAVLPPFNTAKASQYLLPAVVAAMVAQSYLFPDKFPANTFAINCNLEHVATQSRAVIDLMQTLSQSRIVVVVPSLEYLVTIPMAEGLGVTMPSQVQRGSS